MLHRKSEGGAVVLYTKAETTAFNVDFIVNVPIAVSFDMNELTAFVNSYKLASKTFKVKIV
ncbi:hypothetical protein F0L74_05870 [Chitinophaga agrisoli]|uniref:Uncharacterized protein n=1 Tax=Chitinophaga agrisoli TaxID=2607653 RepID=A0A5B2W0E5_9BACT|nr:hypothetical protein [Chitinophaga agrisoli]KAA2245483.1 hypothetical protein F0L74_05870 [Chitinophaga agrisoli]